MQHHSTDFEKAVSEGSGIVPKIVFGLFIVAIVGALYAKTTGLI
jgi:hypothetical protein